MEERTDEKKDAEMQEGKHEDMDKRWKRDQRTRLAQREPTHFLFPCSLSS